MRINKGYIFALVSVVLYALADAVVKYFVANYNATNIMLVRTLTRFAPFIVIALLKHTNPYKTPNVKANILRALCTAGIGYAFLFAYKFAPMTDVISVSQSSSLIVIPLSAIFLHEKFNKYTAIAIFIGFIGIICAFRPSGNVFQLGTLFALCAAILCATNVILIKKLTASDSELTLIFYQQTLILIVSFIGSKSILLPAIVIFALVLSGLMSGLALYLKMYAYKCENCTYISSTAYFILIPTTIIDFFIYDKSPDMYIIIGAILIIIGCLIANYNYKKRNS